MGMYYSIGGGGVCPDNAAPGNAAGAQCVGERGEGGEVGELQIRAPGNPYSSFSSSSSSLCIRRGFDKKFRSRQCRTGAMVLRSKWLPNIFFIPMIHIYKEKKENHFL
jgi:hypothetical protein